MENPAEPWDPLSVAETDICLAKGLRELATKRTLDEVALMTLRTLSLSAAYRLEKLAKGGA